MIIIKIEETSKGGYEGPPVYRNRFKQKFKSFYGIFRAAMEIRLPPR